MVDGEMTREAGRSLGKGRTGDGQTLRWRIVFRRVELRQARVLAFAVAIAGFGYISLSEVAKILSGLPVKGTTYSPVTFSGFLHPGSAGTAYAAWASAWCPTSARVPLASWLLAFNSFDLVFIAGYGLALLCANKRWNLGILAPLTALVVFDVVEDLIGIYAVTYLNGHISQGQCVPRTVDPHHWVFCVLFGVTIVKWLAAATVLLVAAYHLFRAHTERRTDRSAAAHALGVQKFPLIVSGTLGALLLLSGPPILDQGVDVERSWFLTSHDARGLQSAGLAFTGFALLTALLRYLASVHVGGVEEDSTPMGQRVRSIEPDAVPQPATAEQPAAVETREPSRQRLKALKQKLGGLLPWLVVGGVFYALTAILRATHWAQVDDRAVWVSVGIVLAVPALSALFSWVTAPERFPHPSGSAVRAWKVGRLIAYGTFCILPLSLSRAFVPPFILGYRNEFEDAALVVAPPLVAALVLFVILSDNRQPKILAHAEGQDRPKGIAGKVHPQQVGARRTEDRDDRPGWLLSLLPSVAAVIGAIVGLVLFPVSTSTFAGVVGTIALCFCGLSVFYAVLVISAQLAVQTPYIFRLTGLRRTPVVTLIFVIGAVSTFVATGTPLHNVRMPSTLSNDQEVHREPLQDAFSTWAKAWHRTGCHSVSVQGPHESVSVRPMLFVAAEGGGIRAAVWTVDSMSRLTSTPCGKKSVFVASGVSGGATGLAVMDTSPRPVGAIDALTGERALSEGIDGLLSRDLLAGVFGLNVRTVGAPSDDTYPDRAALMEQAWERDESGPKANATGLAEPFPAPKGEARPWRTVFNGTSVAESCRVLVSDIDFGSHSKNCSDPSNPVPGSYDLFERHDCYRGIPTSTASLLAARFPYVTPSGIIRACSDEPNPGSFQDQVIDGGYSENSGIDTLDGILAALMPKIQATNQAEVDKHPQHPAVVVPMVVYLHNTPSGPQPLDLAPNARPEGLIPPTVGSSGSGVLGATGTLLQRAQRLTATVFPAGSRAASKYRWLTAETFASRAMTVGPEEQPQVALPLGWALSQETIDSMTEALNAYLSCPTTATDPTNPCTQAAPFDVLMHLLSRGDGRGHVG